MTNTIPPVNDRSPREAFLRDLYCLADFFTRHPHLPVPSGMVVDTVLDSPADVQALGAQLGQQVYGSGRLLSHEMPGTAATIRMHWRAA